MDDSYVNNMNIAEAEDSKTNWALRFECERKMKADTVTLNKEHEQSQNTVITIYLITTN